MLIRRPSPIAPSEITDASVYTGRREFLAALGAGLAASALPGTLHAAPTHGARLEGVRPGVVTLDEKLTPFETMTTYGNFYEFGPDKESPGRHAHTLRTRPWTQTIDGAVKNPQTVAIDDLIKWAPLEERIYRLRCVEGWSAVVPWVGYSFSELVKRAGVTGNAKFVEFWSLADAEQMAYVRLPLLDWPYREALRLDEALHPLTLLAFGMYGEVMPKPNGAPVRLVIPWKYGFKGAKSIVRIRFVEKQPETTWMKAGPDEYGFYSNVNPDVPHRRWSQSHERRLGEFLRRKTLPFNGYAEQVAGLYSGMDLRKYF
ncbi:MAG TPA: protein-methionine-sulfoxide reductase catalytic subunit MsrP [Rhodocyclaceae bacterium]|nr:protein-methionine-sulfoxide reductase catalytic subunit MsrP [Rhodocyclaceae bacterium]